MRCENARVVHQFTVRANTRVGGGLQTLSLYDMARPFRFFLDAEADQSVVDAVNVEDGDLEATVAHDAGHTVVLKLARRGVAARCELLRREATRATSRPLTSPSDTSTVTAGASSAGGAAGTGAGAGVGSQASVDVGAASASLVSVDVAGNVVTLDFDLPRMWRELAAAVEKARAAAFTWVTSEFAARCCVGSILLAGQVEVARELLQEGGTTLSEEVCAAVVCVLVCVHACVAVSDPYTAWTQVWEALALAAAREHFNSAPSASHDSLRVARECLFLLPTTTPDISAERQLVRAAELVYELGGTMLPVQLRLASPRIAVIDHVLDANPEAYDYVMAAPDSTGIVQTPRRRERRQRDAAHRDAEAAQAALCSPAEVRAVVCAAVWLCMATRSLPHWRNPATDGCRCYWRRVPSAAAPSTL